MPADLVIPAADAASLREIAAWDGFRPASFAAAEFPVDVVRFEGSASPPLVISRARRPETLKALPASLRMRATEAFERSAARPASLPIPRGRSLDLSRGPLVAGIVNITPDSFSDGGLYFDRDRAVERAIELFAMGADVVDVGGESTRPGTYGPAEEVTEEIEATRVVPVVEGIRRRTDAPVSVDTRRSGVARRALAAGADIVNDVSSLRFDPEMAATAARAGASMILMHMRGIDPRTMQEDVSYGHLLGDIARELASFAARAVEAGVPRAAILVDPGLGFGKSLEGNLALLRHLEAFRTLGFPVAVGASRKRFVRRSAGGDAGESGAATLSGSLACAAAAADAGAALVRVHDVAETAAFLRMRRAIRLPAEPGASRAAAGPAVGAAVS